MFQIKEERKIIKKSFNYFMIYNWIIWFVKCGCCMFFPNSKTNSLRYALSSKCDNRRKNVNRFLFSLSGKAHTILTHSANFEDSGLTKKKRKKCLEFVVSLLSKVYISLVLFFSSKGFPVVLHQKIFFQKVKTFFFFI